MLQHALGPRPPDAGRPAGAPARRDTPAPATAAGAAFADAAAAIEAEAFREHAAWQAAPADDRAEYLAHSALLDGMCRAADVVRAMAPAAPGGRR